MFRRVALFGKYVYVWNSSTKGLFLVSCHWVEVSFSEVINDPESSIKKATITKFSNYERYRRIQDTFAGTIGFFLYKCLSHLSFLRGTTHLNE